MVRRPHGARPRTGPGPGCSADTQTGRPERRSCAAMTDALAIDPPAADATLEAIEGVYRSRGAAFLRVATAITGDAAAAHDSVQEGFALAIRHRGRYRGDGPLEAWIWRLVVNAARSQRRRRAPVPTAGHRGPPRPGTGRRQRAARARREAAGAPAARGLPSLLRRSRLRGHRDCARHSNGNGQRDARGGHPVAAAHGRGGGAVQRVRSPHDGAPGEAGARGRDGPGGVGRRRQAVRGAPLVDADATPGGRAGAGRRRGRGGNRSGGRSRARDALLPGAGTRRPSTSGGSSSRSSARAPSKAFVRSRGSTRVRSAASPTSALPGGHTTSTSRRSPAPARCARSRSRGERRSLTNGATTRPPDAGTA